MRACNSLFSSVFLCHRSLCKFGSARVLSINSFLLSSKGRPCLRKWHRTVLRLRVSGFTVALGDILACLGTRRDGVLGYLFPRTPLSLALDLVGVGCRRNLSRIVKRGLRKYMCMFGPLYY